MLWIGKGNKWTKESSAEELNQRVSPLTLRNVRTSYPGQSSSQVGRPFIFTRCLMSSTECSWCLSVLEDQVTPSCFSSSSVQPKHTPFSSIAFKRKDLFRSCNISEKPSPAEVDSHRCHILDTKVDFSLLPAYVHIAWKICCKLFTLSK